MKTKSKTFARKLIALALAAVLAISCFMGTVSAYAKSTDDYHDNNLAANFMAWAETTDNQTCEALLDWADLNIGGLLSGLLGTDHLYFSQNVVVATITIDAYFDSIDGVIDLLRQAADLLDSYGGLIGGDVKNINLKPLPALPSVTTGDGVISKCGRSYRAVNDAKTIVMALAKTLYVNSNDNDKNKNVIGQFVKGSLSLGAILEGVLGGSVFGLLQDSLNMWNGYESNLVYNLVANVIFENTLWYTEDEANSYRAYLQNNKNGTRWNYDEQLLDKLSTELLQQINVNVTYDIEKNTDETYLDDDGDVKDLKATDNSQMRYAEMKKLMKAGSTFAEASRAVGSDPNLHYTDEGNVLLFCYGYKADGTPLETFSVDKNTKPVEALFNALGIAWKTVLKDTMNLIHVNYSNWENDQAGKGTNYDNAFYYWLAEKNEWNKNNWEANYTSEKVTAWANAVYADYGYGDAQEFIDQVQDDVTLDREIEVKGETASYKDIDATRLFMKLRYSPLADKYFNIQTGPINLFILETGYTNLKTFIENAYSDANPYNGSVVAALNDALVAAVRDFFPQSANIGMTKADGTVKSLSLPTLVTTDGSNKSDIANALVTNALNIFEYAANSADANILNPFYQSKGITSVSGNLTESNFEEAMMPLLISCILQIKDIQHIHEEEWLKCKDAEGVAYVALREYLSYVLPEKDYDQLVTSERGYYEGKVDLNKDGTADIYTDAILPMARDAVGYLLNSIVPCRTKTGAEWNVYKTNVLTDDTTLFDILNSVVCYYGSMEEFTEPNGTKTQGKGVAALLGCVDGSGNCQVKMSNDLWTNIDIIANKLLPVIGTLQYGTTAKKGQANSKELIYDTIVMGLLNIGSTNPHSGKKGITTILEQLVTILTADPLENKSILLIVYDDILASLLNGLLGARDADQGYTQVIPYSSEYGNNASTPFDQLVRVNTLGNYNGKPGDFNGGPGVIGLLISNIYEFFGTDNVSGNKYTSKNMADGCWQGAMFAVKAVNNFIPSFVPSLSEHKFGAATITLDNPSEKVTGGTSRQTVNLKFRNNCTGLNRFYKDANGVVQRSPRFFVNMKSISYGLADGSSISNISTQFRPQVVAPEKTVNIPITGTNPSTTQLIKFTVTYDIFEGEMNGNTLPSASTPLYTDLQATAYLYLSADAGWVDAMFTGEQTDEDGNVVLKTIDEGLLSDESVFTSADDMAWIYNDLLISTANPADVNLYGMFADTSVDGLMALDNAGNAYAAFDAKTGDLLNTGLVDYKVGTGDWNRGSTSTIGGVTVYGGYTANEIATIAQDAQDAGVEFATRTHIALTLEEAGALVKSTKMNGNNYSVITVDKRLITSGNVTASTPTHGLSFVDMSDASSEQRQFMEYDGTTSIKADNYQMTVVAYAGSTEYGPVTVNMILANDAEATTLQNVYNDYIKEMSPYQPTDFDDYNEAYGSSDVNDALQGAFQSAVESISRPVTVENAASLVSTMETVQSTSTTTSEMGDVAYKPIPSTTALVGGIADIAVAYNGYWYIDEAHTMAIYSHDELTAADVTANGTDATGLPVIYNDDDKKYHVATSPKSKTEWTMQYNSMPYLRETGVQDTDGENLLYLNPQFEYHNNDSDNSKLSSTDPWAYKYGIATDRIKKNDTVDYRGYYQRVMDKLAYYVEDAKKHVDTSLIDQITVGIMEDRAGKINTNYEVATYEKMVNVAKEAEALVYEDGTTTDAEGNTVKKYSTSASSVEILEAKRQYDKYAAIAEAKNRGYIGDKLVAEIECAAGSAYTAFTATPATETTDASVVRKSASTTAKYGSYDASGKLVNRDATGEKVYTDESWNAYVTELAKAIKMAETQTTAEGDPAQLTSIYTQKCDLQRAETNLEVIGEATTFRFSGQVVIASNTDCTTGSTGVKAYIYVNGKRVTSTDNDGVFATEIDLGTTEITIKPAGAVKFADRVVTVDGANHAEDVSIPVNAFDLNGDAKVNSTDAVVYSDNAFDINGDGNVTNADGTIFKSAMRSGVTVGSLSLN